MGLQVCGMGVLAAISVGGSALAQAPAPKDKSPAAVAAWIKAQLDPGPFTLLETDDKGALFYVLDDDAPADARVRAWLRHEYFTDQPASQGAYRSDNLLTEMDCEKRAMRLLAVDWFPQLNLKGEPRRYDDQDPRWVYDRQADPATGKLFADACAAKQAKLAGPARTPFR